MARPLEADLAVEVCRAVSQLSGGTLDIAPAEVHVPAAPPGAILRASSYLAGAGLPPGTIALVSDRLDLLLLGTVMGWSAPRRCVAVVSASGLEHSHRRLAVLVAHEAGHLLGLGHCRSAGCPARPVRRAEELDGITAFCGRCRDRLRR